jgi:hypothetical protein
VSFNGKWPVYESRRTQEMLFPVGPYTQHVEQNVAFNFAMDARDVSDGWNKVTVLNNGKGSTEAVRVMSIELGIMA